jgi:glyoxylase-like metal-dependent hydrolase (beta-lactamase superfamily II)
MNMSVDGKVEEIFNGIHLISGGFTNLFLIKDGQDAALVDAYWSESETDIIQEMSKIIDPKKLNSVILTHGHPDHAGACPVLVEKTRAIISAHVADAWMVEDPSLYFPSFYLYGNPTRAKYDHWVNMAGGKGVQVGRILRDGDVVRVGSRELEVIHTPGHSYGSISVYDRREKALITGDTPVPGEWIPTWLGFIVDAGLYKASLERMRSLKPRQLGLTSRRRRSSNAWTTMYLGPCPRYGTTPSTPFSSRATRRIIPCKWRQSG